MNNGLSSFMAGKSSRYVAILPSKVAIDYLIIGDIMVLVCHVISLDHVIKGSCELEGGSQVTTLP